MFEQFNNLSQDELIALRVEKKAQNEKINSEIKTYYKKLKKGLIWWIICLPFLGFIFYRINYTIRMHNDADTMAEIGARKFKQSKIQMEIMKLNTLILE